MRADTPDAHSDTAHAKVPAVTAAFWAVKILATTLGETGGDAASMSLGLGYIAASGIFAAAFAVLVGLQIRARAFHPALYWATVVATTTLGTTLADFADRSMGIGYAGGSLLLCFLLAATLGLWRWREGSVAVTTVTSPRIEAYYWVAILFSQTLGTALGDWVADTNEFGYERGAMVFSALLAVIACGYFFTRLSCTALFWAAFILTRPLGATLGDLLDKPRDEGGFGVDRFQASAILAVLMVLCLIVFRARRAKA